jgi:anti-sigma regulatory factor (Ser/Thr protein kinase)
MSAAIAARSADLRARAGRSRDRAAALRRESAQLRGWSEELCDQLVDTLLRAGVSSFGGQGDRFLLRLGRVRSVVRFARHDLRGWLEAADVPLELVSDLTLACSEACANAVEHPQQATRQLVEIEARRDGSELELRVRDYGSWSEHRRSELRGRGLGLIDELVDSADVERRAGGTEIVMRRSLGS